MSKPTVAVLFGGRSSEHGISCVTASGVLAAIDREKWNVVAVGITPDGTWVPASSNAEDWRINDGAVPQVSAADNIIRLPRKVGEKTWYRESVTSGTVQAFADIDVVFPLLHGPYGEDGTLQGTLEMLDIRYVGCGVVASSISMDKIFMRMVFRAAGLPVCADVTLPVSLSLEQALAAVQHLPLPVFVKPARAGSSIGISKVSNWDDFAAALEEARAHDPKVLVEQGVVGREVECAVMEAAGEIRTSPIGEIITSSTRDFYDYEAKYFDTESVQLQIPAAIDDATVARVQNLARAAFEAVGAEGLSRVDCFVTDSGEILINEINTLPGFTPFSMYPQLWQEAGVSYTEIVESLIAGALAKNEGLR